MIRGDGTTTTTSEGRSGWTAARGVRRDRSSSRVPSTAGTARCGYSSGRVKIISHLAVDPELSIDRVTLPYRSSTAKLVSSRVTYTVTPLIFVSASCSSTPATTPFRPTRGYVGSTAPGKSVARGLQQSPDSPTRGIPDLHNRSSHREGEPAPAFLKRHGPRSRSFTLLASWCSVRVQVRFGDQVHGSDSVFEECARRTQNLETRQVCDPNVNTNRAPRS